MNQDLSSGIFPININPNENTAAKIKTKFMLEIIKDIPAKTIRKAQRGSAIAISL